jgi:conjugative relaxase-like TrwC/TraI family protein
VRGAGVGYYVGDLVPGRAEGSMVAGESPGEWSGRGCAALGLRGTVEGPIFAEVLAGRDPRAGVALRDARGNRPVSGFDLTFCAPKSVSVLHLLAPRELGTAAVAAHVAAVADALAYVERNGLGVRRSRSGEVRHLAATGAVAAGFVHRTSRALDPHLHSHVVTANVAEGVDGTWSSLDSRRLHLHRRATGAVYDSALRHHLTAAAGVAWHRGPSGAWEVAGVDAVLRRLFSQRAASIDEHVARIGAAPSMACGPPGAGGLLPSVSTPPTWSGSSVGARRRPAPSTSSCSMRASGIWSRPAPGYRPVTWWRWWRMRPRPACRPARPNRSRRPCNVRSRRPTEPQAPAGWMPGRRTWSPGRSVSTPNRYCRCAGDGHLPAGWTGPTTVTDGVADAPPGETADGRWPSDLAGPMSPTSGAERPGVSAPIRTGAGCPGKPSRGLWNR